MPHALPAVLPLLFFCLFPASATMCSAAEPASVILSGKAVTTVTRAVPMPFNAIVDDVLVNPGDVVEQSAPLLRYHLQEEAERVLQREITIGAGTEETGSQVLEMERRLAEMTVQRNKARHLANSGLGSKLASARLEDDVRSLQQRIALLRSTIRKKESNFAARLKELEGYYGVPVREGEQLPASLVLTSPINGHVLALEGTLNPGVLLNAGAAPVHVGRLDPMLIQVHVYEAEIAGIKVGDNATVKIPSLDNKKFAAAVNEISWVSTDMNVSNPSYYMVELSVSNPDLDLKPGFKAVVHFGGRR
ncbi:HlyD family secretion protein [Candidatus Desulfovibrio trichonymphae]|uniref:Uncharacterized outer membrane efflux protein n=1 Tax=Candidatus Desulfovibrio trichonymphae TaxID=1725232 RepID=A0A1J1DRH5_9BACT|nr:efflux RND transporter periplasmic adaptor subunit [Candidatus Desulfovibrio trichonymphae]BAV92442.1 uncharacterized outer membrane efflux protein [Candidatus Desulfovibrio trichonymphae]